MSRGFKIAIGLFLALFVVAIVVPGFPVEAMILWELVTGWVGFLGDVLPKVQVNWSGVGLLVLCLGLTGALAHGFSGWLWRGTGHADPWRPRWTATGLGMVVLTFTAGMAFTGVAHQAGWLLKGPPVAENYSRAANERYGSNLLKRIFAAQADFRATLRHENQKPSYWRADLAGLFLTGTDPVGQPLHLTAPEIAGADARSMTPLPPSLRPGPLHGYLLCALAFPGEEKPDPDRFAACAFPQSVRFGKYAYIISQDNVIYHKPCPECKPPDCYPADPVKDGWVPLD